LTRSNELRQSSADAGHSSGLVKFALHIYEDAQVASACLSLQNRYGLDVNVLLFAAYAGAVMACPLSAADAANAQGLVSQWHDDIVLPLRAVRRRLKSGPKPAPSDLTEALRDKIASVEIEAELVELSRLNVLAEALPPAVPGCPRDCAASALETTLREIACHEPDDDDRIAIGTISAAASEYAVVRRDGGPAR
jgi:uncharacterized protein (TIGR02444 family)